MDNKLTTSKIEDSKFYMGQTELAMIVKRIIRHYRYHKNNQDPEAVVIPLIKEVEGVAITYEQEPTVDKPRTGRTGSPSN